MNNLPQLAMSLLCDTSYTPPDAATEEPRHGKDQGRHPVVQPKLEALLRQVLDDARGELEADVGIVYLIEGEQRVLQAQVGLSDQQARQVRLRRLDEGVSAEVLQRGEALVFENVSDDPRAPRALVNQLHLQAYAGVPIAVENMVLGNLMVLSRPPKCFGPPALALLETFARHSGLLVQRSRMPDASQRQAVNLRLLNVLSMQLGSSFDEPTLFRKLVSGLSQLLSVPEAAVYTFDAERAELIFQRALLPTRRGGRAQSFHLGEGLVGKVAQERRVMLVELLDEASARQLSGDDEAFMPVSFAAAPIMRGEDLLGVLGALADEETHFSEEDAELLAALAEHAGIALHNARLLTQFRASAQHGAKTVRQRHAIQQAATHLVAEVGSEALLDHILAQAAELLDADRAGLAICNWSRRDLEFMAVTGMETVQRGDRVPIDGSLTGLVARAGVSRMFSSEEIVQGGYYRERRFQAGSLLFTPLLMAGAVYAVLGMGRSVDAAPFTDEHVKLLDAYAHYAAVVLHASRLIDAGSRSRSRLGQFFATAGNAFFTLDRDLLITSWNEAAAQLFGVDAKDMLGQSINALWPSAEDAAMVHERLVLNEPIEDLEAVWPRKDGRLANVLISLSPFRDAQGQVLEWLGLSKEITQLRSLEREISRLNQQLLAVYDIGSALTPTLDLQQVFHGIVERANTLLEGSACVLRLLSTDGKSLERAAASGRIELLGGYSVAVEGDVYAKPFTTRQGLRCSRGEAQSMESLPKRFGISRPPQHFMIALLSLDDEVLGAVFITRDIKRTPFEATELVLLELLCTQAAIAIRNARQHSALEAAEAKYRDLYDHAPDMYCSLDLQGTMLMCNDTLAHNLGYTKEELLGSSYADLLVGETGDPVQQVYRKLAAAAEPCAVERTLRRKDGSTLPIEATVRAERDAMGRVVALHGDSRDISERKRAEAERTLLVTAYEQAAETIAITDTAATIQYVNPAFERITGYSRQDVVGRNMRILKSGKHDDEYYRRFWTTIKRGEVWSGRYTNRKKDGSLYEVDGTVSPVRDASGKIVNYVQVCRDVTQEAWLEEQVRQAQKMQAIGLLAGGVAHDFNNVLTAILGHADLLKIEAHSPQMVLEAAAVIEKGARQAAQLTKQLLNISREGELQNAFVDIHAIISDVLTLLARTISKKIRITQRLSSESLGTTGDPGQLHQVLLNLALNACDAMPEGGELRIETAVVELDAEISLLPAGMTAGRYALMRVIDSGCGIPDDIKNRIFEPFFTTKEKGRGTGMGLAMVYGIVKNHDGFIRVESEMGQGSTFTLYLPYASDDGEAAPNP